MLFLMLAAVLFALLVGALAFVTGPVGLTMAGAIALWLVLYGGRGLWGRWGRGQRLWQLRQRQLQRRWLRRWRWRWLRLQWRWGGRSDRRARQPQVGGSSSAAASRGTEVIHHV